MTWVNTGNAVSGGAVIGTNNAFVTKVGLGSEPFAAAGATSQRGLADRFIDAVNVKDFGAVGDGVTDDAAAFAAAVAALPSTGGRIVVPGGQYVLKSTLTISGKPVVIVGAGGWYGGYQTTLLKHGTVSGPAVDLAVAGAGLEDLSVRGMGGNVGDNIRLSANTVFLRNVTSVFAGQDGVRIGTDSVGAFNANSWSLINVRSEGNGRHGVYIHDANASPNVNAGTATGLRVLSNTSDGLRIDNAIVNTFVGTLAESNTGWGVNLGPGLGGALAMRTTFVGGDYEANTAGDFQVGANAWDQTIILHSNTVPVVSASAKRVSIVTSGKIRSACLSPAVSADRGDTSQTLTVGVDVQVQRWATALGANRTVTLSTTGAENGDTFRVVRSGLGAFTLDVGGLKTIPSATAAFVEVTYDGSAWVLKGYGTL